MLPAALPAFGCSPTSQKRSVILSTIRSADSRLARLAQYTKISSRSRSASCEMRYCITCKRPFGQEAYALSPSPHLQASLVLHVLHIRGIYPLPCLRCCHALAGGCRQAALP